MTLTNDQLLLRINAIETKMNQIQTALNRLVTRTEMKALQNTRQNEIITLQGEMDTAQSEIEVLQDSYADGLTLNLTASQMAQIEAEMDHTAITNIGTNSHTVIDNHLASGEIHFTEANIDHGSIAGLSDDDHTNYILADGTRAFAGNIQYEQQTQPLTLLP